jgi:hypothetical protein
LKMHILAVLAAAYACACAYAQACDPVRIRCPPVPGFPGTQSWNFANFTDFPQEDFTMPSGLSNIHPNRTGLAFEIVGTGDNPRLVSTNYLFFGKLTFTAQAAAGAGVVSSVMLQSGDLDQISFEWLGDQTAQFYTNFSSQGQTGSNLETNVQSAAVSDPQSTLHSTSISIFLLIQPTSSIGRKRVLHGA